MPIDQSILNDVTIKAINSFVALLPTETGEVTSAAAHRGLEISIGNPRLPDRPLTIFTDGEELTVCFAQSHYHIAEYNQRRTEAELVEQMILGIAGIISGHTRAYSALAGDVALGGGFIEGSSESELHGKWWDKADRWVVSSWDESGDKVVLRNPSS